MDKILAAKIRSGFDHEMQQLMKDYAEYKLVRLHNELETADSIDRIKFIQGRIQEIRALTDLHIVALSILKMEG